MRSIRTLAKVALVLIPATLSVACVSTGTSEASDNARAIAAAEARTESAINEMRYMHGQELLSRMNQLVRMGDDAAPALRAATTSEDWLVRASVLYVLGAMGDRRNIDVIAAATADSNETVRLQAASSLVKLGDGRGFAPLVDALAHADIEVRFRAIRALSGTTGLDFGYRHDDVADERRVAVARWREWLQNVEARAL